MSIWDRDTAPEITSKTRRFKEESRTDGKVHNSLSTVMCSRETLEHAWRDKTTTDLYFQQRHNVRKHGHSPAKENNTLAVEQTNMEWNMLNITYGDTKSNIWIRNDKGRSLNERILFLSSCLSVFCVSVCLSLSHSLSLSVSVSRSLTNTYTRKYICRHRTMYYYVLNCVRRTVYWTVCVVLWTELCASYLRLNCVRRTVYLTVCILLWTERCASDSALNCVRRIANWIMCIVLTTELCASYCVLSFVRRTVNWIMRVECCTELLASCYVLNWIHVSINLGTNLCAMYLYWTVWVRSIRNCVCLTLY